MLGYMTVEEARGVLGLTAQGVSYLCRKGRVRAFKCADIWLLDSRSVTDYQRKKEGRRSDAPAPLGRPDQAA